MSARRQRTRQVCTAVLLAWLFALVSSVAQACMAPAAAAGQHTRHGDHCAQAGVMTGMVTDTARTGGDDQPWMAACAKFCSEATAPTPKASAWVDDGSTHAAPLLLQTLADWTLGELAQDPAAGLPPDKPVARPPLRRHLLLLRLAL